MSKARSVGRDWEFVLKGTEISLGKFVSEYVTPLTLDLQTGVTSTEDTDEIWEAVKEEAMEKANGRTDRRARADSPMIDEAEVEKSFWLSRQDGWVINRKTKKIVLVEFKRTSDCEESYYEDMWKVADKQHDPILTGLRALTGRRERTGGRSCPAGCRSAVGQSEEVAGSPQDLRDREGGWSKDPRETRSYASRRV
jgi:hypothetical protein